MEPLLTTEEIADYLRVEVVTVRRLVTRGELPAYRIGSEFRFMAPDIEAFVKEQRVTWPGAQSGDSSEKFTERMRKVFTLANQEAQELDHHYIGTEHLLLALLREGEGIAAQILMEGYGLRHEKTRELILSILQEEHTPAPPEVPEQAATLLNADEQRIQCNTCSARSPVYFHYCFNCGAKLQDQAHLS